jgi:hypothetical protein
MHYIKVLKVNEIYVACHVPYFCMVSCFRERQLSSWNEAVIYHEYGLLIAADFTVKLNTKCRQNPFCSFEGEIYGEIQLPDYVFISCASCKHKMFTHIHVTPSRQYSEPCTA